MADERMESMSPQGRILLGCGIVLGLCLGFAAGHVSVWSRVSSADPFELGDAAQTNAWPDFSHSGIGNVDSHPTTAANATATHEGADGEPGPFFAAVARRLRTPEEADASTTAHPVRVATDTEPSRPEPDALPFANAAPIDEQTQYREQVTRAIIAQEMPHTTPQEQEIWFDVLRGLEAADVKGILRMRKHVGGDPASAMGMMRPQSIVETPVAQPSRASSPGEDMWGETLDCLRRVRDVRLHNLANAETIGFIPQVPVTSEIGGSDGKGGARLVRVELGPPHGSPVFTGRSLDVAITGNGFFQVKHHDEVRLTRCGRFGLDEDRQLVLATTAQPWRLDPSIKVPHDVTNVVFHPNGEVTGDAAGAAAPTVLGTISLVTVDDPAQLESVGDGLYQPTDQSGPMREAVGGVMLEGHSILMLTAADVEADLANLDRVTRLIAEMTHGVSTR